MLTITLKAGSVPADRIPGILEENGIRVNLSAEKIFSHPRFSAVLPEDTRVIIASLREIGLENGAALGEIFQRLPQAGLKPCSPGTGLFLRLAWPDQPMSRNSVSSFTPLAFFECDVTRCHQSQLHLATYAAEVLVCST